MLGKPVCQDAHEPPLGIQYKVHEEQGHQQRSLLGFHFGVLFSQMMGLFANNFPGPRSEASQRAQGKFQVAPSNL